MFLSSNQALGLRAPKPYFNANPQKLGHIMSKRRRVDSATGIMEAYRQASTRLDPPENVELDDLALSFWDDIVYSREVATWSKHELNLAANLARTMSDIERLSREVAEEGHTVETRLGGTMLNPKSKHIDTLTRLACSLSVKLHVHAAAQGVSVDKGKKNQAQRAAGRMMDALEETGGLIATPKH